LVLVEFGDGRVPQHDPLGGAEASDIGVHSVRVLAFRDFVHPAALDARAIGQRQNFAFELLVLHRPEFVEKGLNPNRRNQDDQDEKGDRQQYGVKPPPTRAFFQQQIRNPKEKKPDNQADQQPFDLIAEPFAESLVRKPKRMLTDEILIIAQWKIDREIDEQEDGEVNYDDEIPPPAQASRPITDARGESREQEQGRNQ